MIEAEELKRMRACAPMLPEPADRVVIRLLDELERRDKAEQAAVARYEEVMAGLYAQGNAALERAVAAEAKIPNYMFPTIEDWEESVGYPINEAGKIGWTMARSRWPAGHVADEEQPEQEDENGAE